MKRTDLISELTRDKSGFKCFKKRFGNALVTVTKLNESAGKLIKKPIGKYCTVSCKKAEYAPDTKQAIVYCLKLLFGGIPENLLIVGLGNRDITPDALGVLAADGIINTRHLKKNGNKVCTLIPSVAGKTGIESGELICAAVKEIKPDAMLIIDALASKNKESVFGTVQLTDTGIAVGSGAYAAKKEFSKNVFGFPVIAVGIPTVIERENMMLTPKDVDILCKNGAELLSAAINSFLYS